MRELAALDTPEMRLRRLIAWLRQAAPLEAAATLHAIVEAAGHKHSLAQAALHALVLLPRYEEEIGYERFSAIYAAAAELGHEDVKRLLHAGDPHRRLPRDGAPDNELIERTLGERKALARSRDRDILDRLMHDRHPDVINVLLENPRLTERDVVRMAAMRPSDTRVLSAIVESPKWIARYAVKKALVCNPYTPTGMALSLMSFLLTPDLRMIAGMATLDERVRRGAEQALGERNGS